jgi:hypothetical protein
MSRILTDNSADDSDEPWEWDVIELDDEEGEEINDLETVKLEEYAAKYEYPYECDQLTEKFSRQRLDNTITAPPPRPTTTPNILPPRSQPRDGNRAAASATTDQRPRQPPLPGTSPIAAPRPHPPNGLLVCFNQLFFFSFHESDATVRIRGIGCPCETTVAAANIDRCRSRRRCSINLVSRCRCPTVHVNRCRCRRSAVNIDCCSRRRRAAERTSARRR